MIPTGVSMVVSGGAVSPENRSNEAAIQAVLTEHYRAQNGLSINSPDRCACGEATMPERGEEDVSVRRPRAFAAHLAGVVVAVLAASPTPTTEETP